MAKATGLTRPNSVSRSVGSGGGNEHVLFILLLLALVLIITFNR